MLGSVMMIRSVRQTKPNVRLIRKAGMIDYSPTRFSKIGSSHNRIRARKGRLNMDVPLGLFEGFLYRCSC